MKYDKKGKNVPKILGKYGGTVAGYVASGGEIIYDAKLYSNGKLSGYRFSFTIGKVAVSFVVGSAYGPWAGLLTSKAFEAVLGAWDTFIPEFKGKMNQFYNNTIYNIQRAY